MKKIFIILSMMMAVILGILLILGSYFGPLTKIQAELEIKKSLEKFASRHELDNALMRVYSLQKGVNVGFAAGHATLNAKYHAASVGKTFTASLLYKLEQEGMLKTQDKIVKYLNGTELNDLFTINGKDHRDEVTIQMLLTHVSGIADYFEGPVTKGELFLTKVEKDLEKIWTPNQLLDFTRENQLAVNIPGAEFYYSDTGYILLGLLVEKVTQMAFADVLKSKIFRPLNMRNTAMFSINKPTDIVPVFVNGVNYQHKNALSIDWSGGGLISTTQDLLKFMLALHEGRLISSESLNKMKAFDHKFDQGIYYGAGMMQFRLTELSMFLVNMPNLYGGVGSTGSYMLTDEENDIYIIMNLGDTKLVEEGVEEIINILMILDRIE